MTRQEIKKRIKALCSNDPFAAAAGLGITVLYSELPDCTKGVCYTVADKRIILINSELSKEESTYVCAHELGHAVLHPELNYSFLVSDTLLVAGKLEREADIFAAELLIDRRVLRQVEYERLSAAQIASHLRLPEKLIHLKNE